MGGITESESSSESTIRGICMVPGKEDNSGGFARVEGADGLLRGACCRDGGGLGSS